MGGLSWTPVRYLARHRQSMRCAGGDCDQSLGECPRARVQSGRLCQDVGRQGNEGPRVTADGYRRASGRDGESRWKLEFPKRDGGRCGLSGGGG